MKAGADLVRVADPTGKPSSSSTPPRSSASTRNCWTSSSVGPSSGWATSSSCTKRRQGSTKMIRRVGRLCPLFSSLLLTQTPFHFRLAAEGNFASTIHTIGTPQVSSLLLSFLPSLRLFLLTFSPRFAVLRLSHLVRPREPSAVRARPLRLGGQEVPHHRPLPVDRTRHEAPRRCSPCLCSPLA